MGEQFCVECTAWVDELEEITGWCYHCAYAPKFAAKCNRCSKWFKSADPRTICVACRDRRAAEHKNRNIKPRKCYKCRTTYYSNRPNARFCGACAKHRVWYRRLLALGYSERLALQLACGDKMPVQLNTFCLVCGKGIFKGRFCNDHAVEKNRYQRLIRQGYPEDYALLNMRGMRRRTNGKRYDHYSRDH